MFKTKKTFIALLFVIGFTSFKTQESVAVDFNDELADKILASNSASEIFDMKEEDLVDLSSDRLQTTLRMKYLGLLRQFHPDFFRNTNYEEKATDVTKKINLAYESPSQIKFQTNQTKPSSPKNTGMAWSTFYTEASFSTADYITQIIQLYSQRINNILSEVEAGSYEMQPEHDLLALTEELRLAVQNKDKDLFPMVLEQGWNLVLSGIYNIVRSSEGKDHSNLGNKLLTIVSNFEVPSHFDAIDGERIFLLSYGLAKIYAPSQAKPLKLLLKKANPILKKRYGSSWKKNFDWDKYLSEELSDLKSDFSITEPGSTCDGALKIR